jgi:hypothetical protein
MTETPFRIHPKGVTVSIRLMPGARMTAFVGLVDGGDGTVALKVSVNAVPEGGKANWTLVSFLAESWGLQKSDLSLLSGETFRKKVVLIKGDSAALMKKLSAQTFV